MLIPINLRADYGELSGENHNRIISSTMPVLSWGGYTDAQNDFQTAYHVRVSCNQELLWDSGVVKTDQPYAKYNGKPLPVGKRIDFSVCIAGNDNVMSPWESNYFYLGTFENLPPAKWICSNEDAENVPAYFMKEFRIDKEILEAAMFVSGIGYSDVSINGKKIAGSVLNPAVSDYTKTCYYRVIPEINNFLEDGVNTVSVVLADGWRRNYGDYLKIYNHTPEFFGTPCLWAAIRLTYADRSEAWIYTDESWKWLRGPVTFCNLFHGERYDARPKSYELYPVEVFSKPLGKLKPMTIPPITERKILHPVTKQAIGNDKYIVDFGTNLSGVLRIKIPDGMKKGEQITLRHAQLLHDDGALNPDNLRGALCEDTYIASGDEHDLSYWQPEFTYHGFRFAEITGISLLQKDDVVAVMLCTDLKQISTFQCGNALMNAIDQMHIHTELCTTHSAFNDTCGRSERLHWLNDGYIRYSAIASNFEIGKMFPHMMALVRDTQDEDGSITCTAPFVYGKRPADPLCSSYLMLAEEAYLRTGNTELIKEYYDSLSAWEQCLLTNSMDFILNYSYYGDWAGPKYSRDPDSIGGGAGSKMIPPIMVGTATLIHNARMLKKFAEILGKKEDAAYYDDVFEKSKKAFLAKWYDVETCKVFNGSQSCQAIALWLDILPKSDEVKAAEIMRDDLVENDYLFTTGAYCLKFMCEMLIQYGYINEFYELITRESYPSLGYMIQCGATTGWEKFEYLTGNSMNAHIHPIQSTIAQCFYRYIAGIVPVGAGASEFNIRPYYPEKLHTASASYHTIRGDLFVRWSRIDGKTNLCVSVPFNTKANIYTPDGVRTVGSGSHNFSWEGSNE